MINFCFTKQHRLQKSVDFKALSSGKTIKKQYFIVLYQQQDSVFVSRLGITVSKSCSKRAVDRNRLKRIIRESFRLYKNQLGPLNIVVIGRKFAVTATNENLFKELENVWLQLKTLCKEA